MYYTLLYKFKTMYSTFFSFCAIVQEKEANNLKIKFILLIYNRVVDKMKVVYPFYESVIIKKPKKVNV